MARTRTPSKAPESESDAFDVAGLRSVRALAKYSAELLRLFQKFAVDFKRAALAQCGSC